MEKPQNVKQIDLWTMLLCTVRYALGRMSYITNECEYLYTKYKHLMSTEQITQIGDEIEDALSRANRAGTTLGMPVDHASWERMVHQIRRDTSTGLYSPLSGTGHGTII